MASLSDGLTASSKRNPCGVCGRTKDGDCRLASNGTWLCHNNTEQKEGATVLGVDGTTYAFTGVSGDGRTGIFKVHEPRGKGHLRVVASGGTAINEIALTAAPAAALPDPAVFSLARWSPAMDSLASKRDGEYWHYDENHRQQRQGTGKSKKIYVHHRDANGKWQKGGGTGTCLSWNELCLAAADGTPLYIEGEKCADVLRGAGLLSVSMPGHEAESVEKCTTALARHKDLGVELVAYVADNDEAGQKKMAVMAKAAAAAGLPFVGVNAGDIWPDLEAAGNVDDLTFIDDEELITDLQKAFQKALTASSATNKKPVLPKADRSFDERWQLLEDAADELVVNGGSTIRQRSSLANTATELGINRLTQGDLDRLLLMAQRRSRPLSKPLEGGAIFKVKREPFVVEGIFLHGLNLLVSSAGVGKSRLCCGLAAALLRGDGTFMSRKLTGPPVDQRRVLIIGTDQLLKDWATTMAPYGLCEDLDPFGDDSETSMKLDPRVTLHPLETDTKLDEDGLAEIRRWCDANPDCLVVVDSLAAVLPPGIDEEKPAAAQPLYALQEAIGSCWAIITHHARKAAGKEGNLGVGAGRGSSAIDGAVSRVITLGYIHDIQHGQRVARETDPRRELLSTKRGGATEHLVVNSNTWALEGTAEELKAEERRQRAEENLNDDQAECLAVLDSDPEKWFTTREIVEALGVDWLEDKANGGKIRNATSKRMLRLETLGLVEKANSGTDKSFRIRR